MYLQHVSRLGDIKTAHKLQLNDERTDYLFYSNTWDGDNLMPLQYLNYETCISYNSMDQLQCVISKLSMKSVRFIEVVNWEKIKCTHGEVLSILA